MISGLSTFAQNAVALEPGRYIHWGVIQISVANLAIIAVMTVLFVLALVVPFPSGHGEQGEQSDGQSDEQGRPR